MLLYGFAKKRSDNLFLSFAHSKIKNAADISNEGAAKIRHCDSISVIRNDSFLHHFAELWKDRFDFKVRDTLAMNFAFTGKFQNAFF